MHALFEDVRTENWELYLVVSVLVLNVLSNKSHGVDCLLQVRLLLQLAGASAVTEPRVESGEEVEVRPGWSGEVW